MIDDEDGSSLKEFDPDGGKKMISLRESTKVLVRIQFPASLLLLTDLRNRSFKTIWMAWKTVLLQHSPSKAQFRQTTKI